jgi:hypothetical protein
MAARGSSYQRILEKYFPGTVVAADRGTGRRASKDTETRGRGDAENVDVNARWQPDLLIADVPLRASPRPRVSASHFFAPSPHLPVSVSHFVPPSRFITISSEHFRVTYPADVARRDADQVLTILENARANYLQRAGNPSGLSALDIRINESTGDFTGRTGQPWWAAAATKGNRIELQPVAILKRRGVLNTTLKHELAHVIIDLVSHDRAPRWLEEGFAIYLAGEGGMYSHGRRGMLSDEELQKRLEHPKSQDDMRASYADSYLKVKEMIRTGGEASVWKKLAAQ